MKKKNQNVLFMIVSSIKNKIQMEMNLNLLRLNNILIEPFSYVPSYKLFVNKTSSILKNKKRLYKLESEPGPSSTKPQSNLEITEEVDPKLKESQEEEKLNNEDLAEQSPTKIDMDNKIFEDLNQNSFAQQKPFTPKYKNSITVRKYYSRMIKDTDKIGHVKGLKSHMSQLAKQSSKAQTNDKNKIVKNQKSIRKDTNKRYSNLMKKSQIHKKNNTIFQNKNTSKLSKLETVDFDQVQNGTTVCKKYSLLNDPKIFLV